MLKNALAMLALAAAATLANAASVSVSSYSMRNGDTGAFTYFDESYTPAAPGCTTTNACPLAGGRGDLTDGIIATSSWDVVEAPAGNGPYVGWRNLPAAPIDITFFFGGPVTLDAATFYLDDSNSGGVSPPLSITLTSGAFSQIYAVPDPVGTAPFAFTATFAPLTATFMSARLGFRNDWIFASEVAFSSSVAAIPEPSTYALMLAGLALVGFAARRRQHGGA